MLFKLGLMGRIGTQYMVPIPVVSYISITARGLELGRT